MVLFLSNRLNTSKSINVIYVTVLHKIDCRSVQEIVFHLFPCLI